jgi:hypothetical protein
MKMINGIKTDVNDTFKMYMNYTKDWVKFIYTTEKSMWMPKKEVKK